MNPHAGLNLTDSLDGAGVSRKQAAQLLKIARAGGGDVVTEAIDWAYVAMPDRAIVQRLKIRSLMRTGQWESADALLAQALLLHPTDPVLSTLRAERLLAKGRLESAAREIDLVLARQPWRPTAMAIGAAIAMKQGEFGRAAALLSGAVDARPSEPQLRIRLVEAMLADGQTEHAAQQLAYMINPPALLEARVLRAQGRAIDALARLQHEWSHGLSGKYADDVAAVIVELLEEVGRLYEMGSFVAELNTTHPKALARAAEACLLLGRFEEATHLGAMLLKRRAFVPTGRGILLVAATMRGNFGIAQRVVRQLVTSPLTIDRLSLADLWRRGMIGRLIRTNTALGPAAQPAPHSVLATMAQAAAELFREELAEAEANHDAATAGELMHLIRQCVSKPAVRTASRGIMQTSTPAPEGQAPTQADEPASTRRAA